MNHRYHVFLQHHRRLIRSLASLLLLVASLITVFYVTGQRVHVPDNVPLLGGIRLDTFDFAKCTKDPALYGAHPLALPATSGDGRPLNYLHTCGARIYDTFGREAMITGLNWFGMETETQAPHGLWKRNWQAVLDQVAQLGYNTIRFPFSNEMLHSSAPATGIDYAVNPDLRGLNGLPLLDKLIEGARQRGLKVVLDRHRPTSAGQSTLWYTTEVSEQQWLDDWVKLAQHYANDDTVIGFDLHNEPREGATWGSGDPRTDWRLAAERAGNAILAANPFLLIFVEGVEQYSGDYYWWGGNLVAVSRYPVVLDVPNRVVYSPHDYGPEVFEQGWFTDPSFPRNLPSVWDGHWGFIARENIAPVVVGEFGGRSVGDDPAGVWQRSLLDYMHRHHVGFFNWSLNPNSGDTGGLLADDWLGVMHDKQDVYRAYLAPPIGVAALGSAAASASSDSVHVLYRTLASDASTSNVSFSLQIANEGAQPLDLTHLELRYWLRAGERAGQQVADIDYAAIGNEHVEPTVVGANRGQQDSYVRITFAPGTPPVPPYQTSGEIMVRVHKADWLPYSQAEAFSFLPKTDWFESTRIALFRNGRLLWGSEPSG